MTVTPAQVIEEAHGWLGVPFRHQGRTRTGVDCVGLIIGVCQALELLPSKFERRDYGRLPTRGELDAKIMQHCTRARRPVPGCLLAIRWNKDLAHVALYTGTTLIHAYESAGGVVEHGFRGAWTKLVDSAWRLPGVTYE